MNVGVICTEIKTPSPEVYFMVLKLSPFIEKEKNRYAGTSTTFYIKNESFEVAGYFYCFRSETIVVIPKQR